MSQACYTLTSSMIKQNKHVVLFFYYNRNNNNCFLTKATKQTRQLGRPQTVAMLNVDQQCKMLHGPESYYCAVSFTDDSNQFKSLQIFRLQIL